MREFYIEDDGIRLHAKLDMPAGVTDEEAEAGKVRCPLAVVIHGLTGHMEETHIRAVASLMNEMGIASLRVEMYGHGQSGGKFYEHNIIKWLSNAMRVTDYARSLPFVTDMYLCGHSQGGITAMLLAGMEPEVYKALLPLSPGTMIAKGARTGRLFGIEFDPLHVPDEIYVNSERKVSGNYIRAAQLVDVDQAIRQYRGPVLIVHGDEDEAIPVHFSAETASQYSNAELVIIQGDDHCYNYHLDQVLSAVRTFIEKL